MDTGAVHLYRSKALLGRVLEGALHEMAQSARLVVPLAHLFGRCFALRVT